MQRKSFHASVVLVALALLISPLAAPSNAQQSVDFRSAVKTTKDAIVAIKVSDEENQLDGARQGIREWMFNGRFQNQGQGMFIDLATINSRVGFAVGGSTVIGPVPKSATEITITDSRGKDYDGKVVVRDHVTGLAAIKVEGAEFVSFVISSESAESGTPVVTSWMQDGAVVSSAGMIASDLTASDSSLGFTHHVDFNKQSQSNGQPVVDSAGVLVGVLVQDSHGTTRCLPAAQIDRLVETALGEDPVELKRGMVGIQFDSESDASIITVSPGSAAEEAELKVGDKILKIEGYEISSASDVVAAVATVRSGDEVKIRIKRSDEELEKTLVIKEHPNQESIAMKNAMPQFQGQTHAFRFNENGDLVPWKQVDPNEVLKNLPQGFHPAPLQWPNKIENLQIERSNIEDTLRDMQKRLEELNERLKGNDEDNE